MPGRPRWLKPEVRESAEVACLSDGAARLYLLLPTLADDQGRCPAGASYLAGAVFFGRPRSANIVGRFLSELEASGLITRYEVNGAPFLEIVGWSVKGSPTYQFIKNAHPFRFPGPTGNSGTRESTRASTRTSTPDLDHDQEHDHDHEQDHARGRGRDVASPRPDFLAVRDSFNQHYETQNAGARLTWTTRKQSQVADLIKTHGGAEVERRLRVMFDAPPEWLRPPFDVGTFYSHFDKLATASSGKHRKLNIDANDYRQKPKTDMGGAVKYVGDDVESDQRPTQPDSTEEDVWT